MSDIPDRVRQAMDAVHNLHVLATVDADGQPHMRWMGAVVEDADQPWTFYLACSKDSRKMAQLAANPNAQLLFTKQDTWEVATLSGTAEEADCPERRKLIWDAIPQLSNYYSGPDDPNMTLIKFKTRCLELLAVLEGHEVYCLEL